ncbi:MAG: serine/threonine protein kinase [Myxococcaceae bacterium]|nr:serine/threonine protein kinase [Myxococcaceae bacterium]
MSSSKRPPVELGDDNATQVATTHVETDAAGHIAEPFLRAMAQGELEELQRELVMAHLVSCALCREKSSAMGLESTVRAMPSTMRVTAPQRVPPKDPLIGQQAGEYQILATLDEGAMGVVYRGVQPVIGKPVAIKVMQHEFARDPENSHRLVAEARAVNAIGHPNIVDVFSFGTLPDGRQYLVMELLTGKNLRHAGREDRLTLTDSVDILSQVAAALAGAHAAGVVHRDLKPSNVFIGRRLGLLQVKVLDFGVAKGLNRVITNVATQPGLMIGTAGYMAPEQILGLQVGPPADVYALGCVAYWLLSREEVFSSESDNTLFQLHLHSPPPPLTSKVQVPSTLAALVEAMLAKEAHARPSAEEVHQRLNRLLASMRQGPAVKNPNEVPTLPPAAPAPKEPQLAAPTLPEMQAVMVTPEARDGVARRVATVPPPPGEGEDTLRPPVVRAPGLWRWVGLGLLAGALALLAVFIASRR